MLKKLRRTIACIFLAAITLLFLDFTGSLHAWFGWMAKIQFLPALLSLNLLIVISLVVLTIIFGRIYCSVICPLGIMQDLFAHLGLKCKKNRYGYSPAKNILRYTLLALFVAAIIAGISSFVSLLAPYSAYGRIAGNLLSPLWIGANNLLAYIAERADSYAFYSVPLLIKSIATFAIAAATLIITGTLAWRNGRTYCNTICPVGTLLGTLSRFSKLKPVIDTTKCNNCGLCARNCKAACIDNKNHTIDYSRCVVCMNCIDNCKKGAISYTLRKKAVAPATQETGDNNLSRRSFLSATGLLAVASIAKGEEKKMQAGLAAIEEKKVPNRETRIVPPGSQSIRNMAAHCTSCQLCVSVCPNEVLRPSEKLETFMQPEMSYERGYCRPECTRCSEVCPTGAIRLITKEDKSATQIGHAVVIKENCVTMTDGVNCGNCERHCPVGAIKMIPSDPQQKSSPKIPTVNLEKCIGCGACEHLCPARPLSAIYVEGHVTHRTI